MRIVAAMSGGVDSSVAALLLREAGHEVIAVFLRNGVKQEAGGRAHRQGCCSVDDAVDARRVADHLGLPFFALDYGAGFQELIEDFVSAYDRGMTPSPCVLCNSKLKFGTLVETARRLGAQAVATGHYARRIERPDGSIALARAADAKKDQTYFLASLTPDQLAFARFPLGDMTKDEVRERARQAGLRTAEKPESMEVCFVPGGDYRELLRQKSAVGLRAGAIVAADGTRLGTHEGYQGFTIGQRRGLGVALGEPAYVTAVDPARNEVTLGPKSLLERSGLVGERCVWSALPVPTPGQELRARVQIRHRSPPAPATVRVLDDARVGVRFDRPVSAVAPGQALAVFDEAGEHVLGGGFIAPDDPRAS